MKYFFFVMILFLTQKSNLFGQILRNVKLIPQQTKNWCYAACTEMVFNHSKIIKNQSQIVKEIQNIDGELVDCDLIRSENPSFHELLPLNRIESHWVKYFHENGFSNARYTILKKDEMLDEIKKAPMIVLFGLGGNLKHAMVVSNIFRENALIKPKLIFEVLNPANTCKGCNMLMLFDEQRNEIVSQNKNRIYSLSFNDTKVIYLGSKNNFNDETFTPKFKNILTQNNDYESLNKLFSFSFISQFERQELELEKISDDVCNLKPIKLSVKELENVKGLYRFKNNVIIDFGKRKNKSIKDFEEKW